MKSLRTSLSVAILMSLAAVAFGQSERAKVLQQTKTLAGSWEGTVDGKSSQASHHARNFHGQHAHARNEVKR